MLPISALAFLAYIETRESADGNEAEPRGEVAEPGFPQPEPAEAPDVEELLGIPITSIELGVALVSLLLSVVMAMYISRTIVRPIHELETSMSKVEAGDLEVKAPIRSDDELGRLAKSFNRMVEGVRREALIRDLFGQYVTPELVHEAIEHGGKLDGQLVTSTILFSDIRNFTGVSEDLPASTLVQVLNRYFSRMSEAVVGHGGLVNKFGGDSLLAVFGSPLNPANDHPVRAVKAALAMCGALDEFNEEQTTSYLPEIMIGIGIATGDVVAGNIGSAKKLEYTVIGDAVNVAARLQGMTKESGHTILASAETVRSAPEAAEYVEIGALEVRGKTKKVRVFSVQLKSLGGDVRD